METNTNLTRNIAFLERYKDIDSFLRDAYRTDTGVTTYLSRMEQSSGAGVPSWENDYRRMKHLRWIRNQLTHELGYGADICEPEDLDWLDAFYDRLLKGTDPLAALASVQRQRQKRARAHTATLPDQPVPVPVRKTKKSLWERIMSFFTHS